MKRTSLFSAICWLLAGILVFAWVIGPIKFTHWSQYVAVPGLLFLFCYPGIDAALRTDYGPYKRGKWQDLNR